MEKIWLLRLVTDIDDRNGYQDYGSAAGKPTSLVVGVVSFSIDFYIPTSYF